MCIINLFALSLEVIERAAKYGLELRPAPDTWVKADADKGHYLSIQPDIAFIIAVDDYRPSGGIYRDLLPGYHVREIIELPFSSDVPADSPNRKKSFTAINYIRDKWQGTIEQGRVV